VKGQEAMKKGLILMAIISWVCVGCSKSSDSKDLLDPKDPVTVTIWHYYNGSQLKAFDKLVQEFNMTVGAEKGIIVEGESQGNVESLEQAVLDSVLNKAGAKEMPSVFAAYADTAYEIDSLGMVVDLSPYFTREELDSYVDSYIEEGYLDGKDALKILPIAKSTEIFVINKTDWQPFADACGYTLEDLQTVENITKVAKAYYEWSDARTPAENDGKAFFGRDAMANYMIIGAKQLGSEIFSVKDGKAELNFDKRVMKKLWENYYVPFVKGYFSASGGFRSDDVKTGNILSFVGSSSGAMFFPDEVTVDDNTSYPIELEVIKAPVFEGGENFLVQQGAGMVVTDTNEREIYASVEFLKWFTQEQQNIEFSLMSGYLPVKKGANDLSMVKDESLDISDKNLKIVKAAMEEINTCELYTTKAFEKGGEARRVLEYALSDQAKSDREMVEERLKQGCTLEEASKEFIQETAFEHWYANTKQQLESAMQE
jgi:multiple sugar transport system substrate-binding protein